jgi:lipopolysaccharide/colanic/teichoic acid biosynthesis glycosyltransferase
MLKRLFDVLISFALLLVLSPAIMIILFLVSVNMGKPVLFLQMRPGKGGDAFKLLKIRSMKDTFDADDKLLSDAERITPFGRFLRNNSLDELPSLLNVLKGEMSLVGPRPLLMEYLPLYSAEQSRRHEVRPGITGWAQINGRNAVSWDEKFKMDVWYVDNRSLWLDLKVLFFTVKKVILRDGISAKNCSTMPIFKGSSGE